MFAAENPENHSVQGSVAMGERALSCLCQVDYWDCWYTPKRLHCLCLNPSRTRFCYCSVVDWLTCPFSDLLPSSGSKFWEAAMSRCGGSSTSWPLLANNSLEGKGFSSAATPPFNLGFGHFCLPVANTGSSLPLCKGQGRAPPAMGSASPFGSPRLSTTLGTVSFLCSEKSGARSVTAHCVRSWQRCVCWPIVGVL